MKKSTILLTMAIVIAAASAIYAFDSLQGYSYGKADAEYTMAVVGATGSSITAGQWVAIATSDNQGLDTCATVKAVSTENTAMVLGVAMNGGDTGTFIRVCTRGRASALVCGADSGVNAGLVVGSPLASSRMTGSAGAASTFITTSFNAGATAGGANAAIQAYQAAATSVCGYMLESVATTDTGLYNKYAVWVTCR